MRRSGCCQVIGCSAGTRGIGRASRPRANRCCTSPNGMYRSAPIRCSSRRTHCGPSTSATRRWSSGRSATRRTPRRSMIRPTRSDGHTGSRPRSRSTSSGTRRVNPIPIDNGYAQRGVAHGAIDVAGRDRLELVEVARVPVAPVDIRPCRLRAGRAADGGRPHERADVVRVPRWQHDRPRRHPGWLARARSSSSLTSASAGCADGRRRRPAPTRSRHDPGDRQHERGQRQERGEDGEHEPDREHDAEECVPSRSERVADAVAALVHRFGRRRRRDRRRS